MCVGEFDGMRGLREEWEREREKERDEMREMDASGQSLFDMPK